MATILLANELGGGLGHVNRLLAIARHLSEHRLVFSLPEPSLAGPVLSAALGPAAELCSCTAWNMGVGAYNVARQPPDTLADTLFLFGFSDPEPLATAVAIWRSFLDEIAPDLVVSDFAPTLRIVTAGRVPNVVVGSGFTVPPPGSPLPKLRPDKRSPPAIKSVRREAAVLAAVNEQRLRLALAPFDSLASLFFGDRTFPASLDPLDPYRELRQVPPLVPFNIPSVPCGGPFAARTGPHVFCYLDADYAGIDALVTALNGMPVPSQIFVRNFDPRALVRHCAPQVGIYQGQADFEELLPQTRLLVHHGELGTTTAGLFAGVPQLLLPRHLEQTLTMNALEPFACSAGLRVGPETNPAELRGILAGLLGNRTLQANALAIAEDLQAERPSEPERMVVEACRAFLANRV